MSAATYLQRHQNGSVFMQLYDYWTYDTVWCRTNSCTDVLTKPHVALCLLMDTRTWKYPGALRRWEQLAILKREPVEAWKGKWIFHEIQGLGLKKTELEMECHCGVKPSSASLFSSLPSLLKRRENPVVWQGKESPYACLSGGNCTHKCLLSY